MNEKFFAEFREHDYRLPRSIRECYGWDAPLHVDPEPDNSTYWGWMIAIAGVGLLIWYVYGWLPHK